MIKFSRKVSMHEELKEKEIHRVSYSSGGRGVFFHRS
jgi:hypothetical protein